MVEAATRARCRRPDEGEKRPFGPLDMTERSGKVSSIFYIIGVIVVIVFILSFLGLR